LIFSRYGTNDKLPVHSVTCIKSSAIQRITFKVATSATYGHIVSAHTRACAHVYYRIWLLCAYIHVYTPVTRLYTGLHACLHTYTTLYPCTHLWLRVYTCLYPCIYTYIRV